MSEFRDAILDCVTDREAGTAELCKNLKTGRVFLAEIQELEDIELNTELGRDAREQMLMHVRDREAAAEIFRLSTVSVTLYGAAVNCQVLRRKDNPASPQVEFGLMKLTEKDS